MEQRKLVKQGRNALTMTLPANWTKKNNLTEKDSVYLEEKDNSIVISSENTPQIKTTSIDVTNLNQKYSYHILTDKYIQGYDVIKIKHNNPQMIEELCSRYISMIIETLTPTHCTLKNIIANPIDNYDNLLKRITQQLLDMTKKLKLYSKQKQNRSFSRDDMIMDYNIIYAMRYFNKYKIKTTKDKQKNFLLLYSIESIGDMIKTISKHIHKEEKIADQIIELVELYIKCIYLNDFKTIYTHIKKTTKNISQKKYIDGLFFSLTEIMSNYISYTLEKN